MTTSSAASSSGTTGFNSIRTLATRLQYFHAVSGGHLATLPLELRLRGKSTTQSHGSPIYFADLTTRGGKSIAEAIALAKAHAQERLAAGFDQRLLDEAARRGLALGAFEESPDEGAAVVDEFFPARDEGAPGLETAPVRTETLGQKLDRKASATSSLGEALPSKLRAKAC